MRLCMYLLNWFDLLPRIKRKKSVITKLNYQLIINCKKKLHISQNTIKISLTRHPYSPLGKKPMYQIS